MTLRVGIDYLPAVLHAPGIGRYARELVRALVSLGTCPDLALFELGGGARRMPEETLGLQTAGERVFRRRGRVPTRALRLLRALGGPGAESFLGRVDLFHRVRTFDPPLRRAPEVLPLPGLPPRGSSTDERLARAAPRAAGLIVFSAHCARLLPNRYGVDPARIHRVPVGCDHWLRDAPRNAPTQGPRRILALGGLRAARHPLTLLRAFEVLYSGGIDARLVLAGHAGDAADGFRQALSSSPARSVVEWIERPQERDMPGLVAGSSLLVHLSDDDETPVTPLEAFSFGLPVVVSKSPVFQEALDVHARYVDPQECAARPDRLADELDRALASQDEQGARTRREIAAGYTWRANAGATISVWHHIRSTERAGAGAS